MATITTALFNINKGFNNTMASRAFKKLFCHALRPTARRADGKMATFAPFYLFILCVLISYPPSTPLYFLIYFNLYQKNINLPSGLVPERFKRWQQKHGLPSRLETIRKINLFDNGKKNVTCHHYVKSCHRVIQF